MSRHRDVQASLAEMDRKLRELQRELELASQPAEDEELEPPRAAPAPTAPQPTAEASPGPPPEPAPTPPPAPTAPQPTAEASPGSPPGPAPTPPPARAPDTAAGARAEADAIIAAARAEAARIVDEAAAQVAEIGTQIDEFQRLRTELQRSAAALVQEYERALRPAPAGEATSHASPPPASDGRQFEGQVVVDVGPFNDIEALGDFEQALAGLAQTEDVYVRGFEGNRALIDLKLGAPVPLLDELRHVLPYAFELVETGYGRITIDVRAPGEPEATTAD